MSEGDPAVTLAFIKNRAADKPLNPHAAFATGGRRLGGRGDGDGRQKDGHSRATGVEIADDAPSSDSDDEPVALTTEYRREMEDSRRDSASTSASERRHAKNANKRRCASCLTPRGRAAPQRRCADARRGR